MKLNADEFLNPEVLKNGPLTILFGMEEFVPPNDPARVRQQLDETPVPRRKWWQVLLKYEVWHGFCRIEPPHEDGQEPSQEQLQRFGEAVARKLGIPWQGQNATSEDHAVIIPMVIQARHGCQALASARYVFNALGRDDDGFLVGPTQVRVWRKAAQDALNAS